jgi:hypothetical protein
VDHLEKWRCRTFEGQRKCGVKVRVECTGVYPMRTSRRSSSSLMVAMMGVVVRFCDASAAFDEIEATGWVVLAELAAPFFEPGLISILVREIS